MESLETDVSYLLGCYVGVVRKIEIELDRSIKRTTESAIEKHLEDFVVSPLDALKTCKVIIDRETPALKLAKKEELLVESGEILRLINKDALQYVPIDAPNFLHGYHTQIPD